MYTSLTVCLKTKNKIGDEEEGKGEKDGEQL